MKKAPITILSLVILIIFIALQVKGQQIEPAQYINTPEFYFTNVYDRTVEGTHIYVECPVTDSHMGNQNITFRIAIFDMRPATKLIMVKNSVVQTLEREMDQDDYYFYNVRLDNPRGTNCSIRFVLKTPSGDYTVLDIRYIVSLMDPAVEHKDEVVYWMDNTTHQAEEIIKDLEEETYIREPLSTILLWIFGVSIIIALTIFFMIKFGKWSAERTAIKLTTLKGNPCIRVFAIILFLSALALIYFWVLEPWSVISEAEYIAKIRGEPFVTPIPFKELYYAGQRLATILFVMFIGFKGFQFGWSVGRTGKPLKKMIAWYKTNDPNADVIIKLEEIIHVKDDKGITREASLDNLTIKEAMLRWIKSKEKVCPVVLLSKRLRGDELKVKLREQDEEYDILPLDASKPIKLSQDLLTKHPYLAERLETDLKKLTKPDSEKTRWQRFKSFFKRSKTDDSDKTGLYEVLSGPFSNKVTTLYNLTQVNKLQKEAYIANENAQFHLENARTSKARDYSTVINSIMKSKPDMAMESIQEINETKTMVRKYDDTLEKEHQALRISEEGSLLVKAQ